MLKVVARNTGSVDTGAVGLADIDEGELISRCRAGERVAHDELYHRFRRPVAANLYRVLGDRTDLDDLVQEVFVIAFRGLDTFRGDARLSTWLYRICLNAIHDHRSRSAKRSATALDDVAEPADPRDRIAEQELSAALQDALSQIDETYRTAVLLYDVLGRSYAEIAEVLAVPEGTVKSRIYRGRVELAKRLGTAASVEESKE